jgi:hypothetical protein
MYSGKIAVPPGGGGIRENKINNKTPVHKKYNSWYDLNHDKRFDIRKDKVPFLICFLFDQFACRALIYFE